MSVRPEITYWIENSVLPRYDAFDKGHRRNHAVYVIETALKLSQYYDVDREMIAVAAACHDLGLAVDRATHHLESGRIIRGTNELRQWFSDEQIETIAQAAEDHRASSKEAPRTIYGKIIAEADRQIIPDVVIRRTIQFGLKNYPGMDKEGHWARTVEHLNEKYAEGGYLRLWIPESPNAARLEELRATIRDAKALRAVFEKVYKEEMLMEEFTFLRAGSVEPSENLTRLFTELNGFEVVPDTQRINSLIAAGNLAFYVVEKDGKTIGMTSVIACRTASHDKYWIEDVGVLSDFRGLGLGKAILKFAMDDAEKYFGGNGTFWLTSRPSREAARNMYRSLGFAEYETGVFKKEI